MGGAPYGRQATKYFEINDDYLLTRDDRKACIYLQAIEVPTDSAKVGGVTPPYPYFRTPLTWTFRYSSIIPAYTPSAWTADSRVYLETTAFHMHERKGIVTHLTSPSPISIEDA